MHMCLFPEQEKAQQHGSDHNDHYRKRLLHIEIHDVPPFVHEMKKGEGRGISFRRITPHERNRRENGAVSAVYEPAQLPTETVNRFGRNRTTREESPARLPSWR